MTTPAVTNTQYKYGPPVAQYGVAQRVERRTTASPPSTVTTTPTTPPPAEPTAQHKDLAELLPDGTLRFTPHRGQWEAWNAEERFIGVIAGAQSGKTSFGPHWLLREIQRCGPGDYLVVTPTFQLLEKKLLPEFRKVFERWFRLGTYTASPTRKFRFSEQGEFRLFQKPNPNAPTTVWFGYADDPESLESMTAKAAWLDEAGQKRFKLASWQAVRRRLSIHRGRALITTTPYDLGWLKQEIYDRWMAGHPDYTVVNFDSTENPAFSHEEFDDVRLTMQPWLFDLFYRGLFTRPAGMIYDNFNDIYLSDAMPYGHKCKPFPIPSHWRRYAGIDFGGVNFCGLLYAEEPMTAARLSDNPRARPRLFLYREYRAGNLPARRHAAAILRNEPRKPLFYGGSASEDQWRDEFRYAGMLILKPPIKDVEVGINRVYACHARHEIVVFDTCERYLEEKVTYSREVDDKGNVLEDIEDKHGFHAMDAERYLIAALRHGARQVAAAQPTASHVRRQLEQLKSDAYGAYLR